MEKEARVRQGAKNDLKAKLRERGEGGNTPAQTIVYKDTYYNILF